MDSRDNFGNIREEIKKQKIKSIIDTINALVKMYEIYGIDGLHELINPSLDDMIDIVEKLRSAIGDLRKDFNSQHGKTINEEEIEIENLELGVLYVSHLLSSIKRWNNEDAEMFKGFTRNSSSEFNPENGEPSN